MLSEQRWNPIAFMRRHSCLPLKVLLQKQLSLLKALQRNQFAAQLLSLRNEVIAKEGGIPRLLQNLLLEPKAAWPRKEPARICISIDTGVSTTTCLACLQDRSLEQDKSHQGCSIYGQKAMEMKPRGKARAQGQSAITGVEHISGVPNTSWHVPQLLIVQ